MMLLSNFCNIPVILCNATRPNVILLSVILMNVMAPFLRVCSMSCFEFRLFHSKKPFLKQKWRCPIILSTCHLVNLSFCQLVIWWICHFVNSSFGEFVILSTRHLVNLSFSSTIHLVNLSFCQRVIWPICHFVNLSFGEFVILSTHHLVNLSFCQLIIWWFVILSTSQ